jgi:cell division protein FtsA
MAHSVEAEEVVVGLDIGTTKIVAMIGKRNEFGKIEILGMGKTESSGVIRGVVMQVPDTAAAIVKAVEEAANKADYDINSVYTGIASQHIKSYQTRHSRICNNTDELISQEDLKALLDDVMNLSTSPGESIISAMPQEYFVDNMDIQRRPVGVPGRKLEANFHIITGRIEEAKRYKLCVEKANLHLESLFLEPLASAEAVLTDEEREAGVALVDIGGGTTDIAIFHDGILRHTAVVPLAGNSITEDIKTSCNIIKNYAELLKVKHGSALPTPDMETKIVTIPGISGRPAKEISMKTLSEIIKARVVQILDLVDFELKSSGFKNNLGAGIVLTGGGAQLKYIQQLTEYSTGLDVRIGHPSQHIVSKEGDNYESPLFATSVGLVMLGFNKLDEKKKNKEQPIKEKSEGFKGIGKIFETFLNKSKNFLEDDETKF